MFATITAVGLDELEELVDDVLVALVELVDVVLVDVVLVDVANGPLLHVFNIGAQVLACQLLQIDW